MKCDVIGCKNHATYEIVTKTKYTTQKANHFCNKHSKQWMIENKSIKGVIMGIEFETTSKSIE
jgi:hypothetical protein